MLYDIRLRIAYDYDAPVAGGRHLVRVMPRSTIGQRPIAASLSFDPQPAERGDRLDFFGNPVTTIAYREGHDALSVTMTARVQLERADAMFDMSSPFEDLAADLAANRSMAADSPHHFLNASPRIHLDPPLVAYARESLQAGAAVHAVAFDLCRRIHDDFAYDIEATTVETPAIEAFQMRRGVCQDFAHIMIAGLRGLGIPAGYVSGYLRTLPPPGTEPLEGADAMHAWVKAWCGAKAGWIEFDPTNAMLAANDHIAAAHGRDYLDVAPIVGVLKTIGSHETSQSVNVKPVG